MGGWWLAATMAGMASCSRDRRVNGRLGDRRAAGASGPIDGTKSSQLAARSRPCVETTVPKKRRAGLRASMHPPPYAAGRRHASTIKGVFFSLPSPREDLLPVSPPQCAVRNVRWGRFHCKPASRPEGRRTNGTHIEQRWSVNGLSRRAHSGPFHDGEDAAGDIFACAWGAKGWCRGVGV